MTRCLTATLGIFALMMVPSFVHADVKDKVMMMKSPTDSKEFAMKAATSGMLEVKLAQLAQQKSQSQEVKQLAQKLEQDHTQANQQLMQVAQQKNIEIPKELQGEAQETLQAFQQLEGKDFDNAFVLGNVKHHLHAVMMFQNEAQNGTDQEIKQWATQTLPKLKQHTMQIRTVAQSVGLPIEALAGSGQGTDAARTAGSRQDGSQPATPRTGTPGTRGGTTGGGSSGTGSGGTSGGTSGGGTSGGGTSGTSGGGTSGTSGGSSSGGSTPK